MLYPSVFSHLAKDTYTEYNQNNNRQYKLKHEYPELEQPKHLAVLINIELSQRYTAIDDVANEYRGNKCARRQQYIRNQEIDVIKYGASEYNNITEYAI